MSRARVLIALGVAAAAFLAAISLGQWQTRRASEKAEVQGEWDAMQRRAPRIVTAATLSDIGKLVPLKVQITGRFDHRFIVWLDNRSNESRAGFNVIAPMVVDGGGIVLVNRGWAPRDPQDRSRLPAIGQPQEAITIEGLALADIPRLLELGAAAPTKSWPVLWQNLDYQEFERASGLRVARFVVLQTSDADDQLARNWPAPATGIEKHRGYALQWYSLAALIVVFASMLGFRAWRAH